VKRKYGALLAGLLAVMLAVPMVSVSAQVIDDPVKPVPVDPIEQSVSTDRYIYRLGQDVEITFTCGGLSHGPIGSWVFIYRVRTGELVKGWDGPVLWIAYPPGTHTYTWDQTYLYGDVGVDGQQVPWGLYRAETPGGNAYFFILPF
jgi:hypothetical protein